MRWIQSRRNWRFRARRSRNAYRSERSRASLAARWSLLLVRKKPLVCLRYFLRRARRLVPRLTRGIGSTPLVCSGGGRLAVRQHAVYRRRVRRADGSGPAEPACTLGRLAGQQVALAGSPAQPLAAGGALEAFGGTALGLQFVPGGHGQLLTERTDSLRQQPACCSGLRPFWAPAASSGHWPPCAAGSPPERSRPPLSATVPSWPDPHPGAPSRARGEKSSP